MIKIMLLISDHVMTCPSNDGIYHTFMAESKGESNSNNHNSNHNNNQSPAVRKRKIYCIVASNTV